MKRKAFVPNKLKNEVSLFSFGGVSTMYWDFASKMESEANREFSSRYNSLYVFPAVIFYCASFEALLNEGLTKLLLHDKSIEVVLKK